MPREKEGYREILEMLSKDHPLLMLKKDVSTLLGISRPHLDKIISQGSITCTDGKIPIGSVARYLCG